MAGTIRQRLKRRIRIAMLFYAAGALLTAWSIRYLDFSTAHSGPILPRLVPVLGMVIFCAGLVISGTGRCPRCLTVVHPFVALYRRCPACGIGLDEPSV